MTETTSVFDNHGGVTEISAVPRRRLNADFHRDADDGEPEGMNGPGVAKLMKASGLTHGGFYKHFRSKDDLFTEAVDVSVRDIGAQVIEWGSKLHRAKAGKKS